MLNSCTNHWDNSVSSKLGVRLVRLVLTYWVEKPVENALPYCIIIFQFPSAQAAHSSVATSSM